MPTMRKAGWFDGIVEEVSGEVGGPGFFLRDGPVDSLTLARFLEGGGYFFMLLSEVHRTVPSDR